MSVSKINFNDNNEAYIVVDPIGDIDRSEFKKYLDIDSPSFLKCEFEKDKGFTLYYNYGNKVTLKQFLSKVRGKREAIDFLKSLTKVYMDADNFSFKTNHILLGINSVFYDEEERQVSCIYVPVNEGILPARPLRLFIKEVLVNMIYSEEDNMAWLGNIIRYINRNRQLEYSDFYDFLQSQEETETYMAEGRETETEHPASEPMNMGNPEVNTEKNIEEVVRSISVTIDEEEKRESCFLLRRSDHSVFNLDQNKMRIGKAGDNEICLSDNPAISRVHAYIYYTDGRYSIQDNESTNHTFVNGNVLIGDQKKDLSAGDRILLGNEELVFKIES